MAASSALITGALETRQAYLGEDGIAQLQIGLELLLSLELAQLLLLGSGAHPHHAMLSS